MTATKRTKEKNKMPPCYGNLLLNVIWRKFGCKCLLGIRSMEQNILPTAAFRFRVGCSVCLVVVIYWKTSFPCLRNLWNQLPSYITSAPAVTLFVSLSFSLLLHTKAGRFFWKKFLVYKVDHQTQNYDPVITSCTPFSLSRRFL